MILEQVIEKFSNRPGLKTQVSGEKFSILPSQPDGFSVWIREEKGRKLTVGFDRWQETFSDATQALACFALGLSRDCRLKVYSRLGARYHWVVQQYVGGLWVDGPVHHESVFSLWPFRKTEYLQNDFLSGDAEKQ